MKLISFATAVYKATDLNAAQKLELLAMAAEDSALSLEDRKEAEQLFNQLCRVCGEAECKGDYCHFE